MKVSLIATVLNEENSIKKFLDSVVNQTKLPDELVIVDGGSTDSTESVISNFQFPLRLRRAPSGARLHSGRAISNLIFKLFKKKGNRSVGRNIAIKNSTGDIIAVSDAGCILDKNWLAKITRPFSDKNIDVVAGYYKGEARNIFQKCLIPYVLVMPDKIDVKTFLPSARSMAMRKSAWKKIGGFPEKYSHNEDYVFSNMFKRARVKIVFAKNAIVYWLPRENLNESFVMFFRFALGDVDAKIIRLKALLLFARYFIGVYMVFIAVFFQSSIALFTIILLFLFYLLWSIFKNYKYVNHPMAFFYLPTLQITSDTAVIIGTTIGLIKRALWSLGTWRGYTFITVKGISWLGTSRLFIRSVSFLRTAVLARLLVPAQFGFFAIASLVLALAELVTETGINIVLVQKKGDVDRYINTAWVISIARGFIISLLIIISALFVSSFFSMPQIIVLINLTALVPLVRGFINPSRVKLVRDLRYRDDFFYTSSVFIAESVTALVFAYFTHSATSIVIGLIVGAGLDVVLSFKLFKPVPKIEFKRNLFTDIVSKGKWLTVTGVSSYLYQNIDNIVVGKLLGAASLGIYDVIYKICLLPLTEVTDVIGKATFPVFVKISHDLPRLRRAYTKSVVLIFVASLLIGIVLFSFPETIISIVLGSQWLSGVPVLRVLSILGVLRALYISVIHPLYALEQQKLVTVVFILGLVSLGIFIIPFVQLWGLIGAAYAALIGTVLPMPLAFYFVWKQLSQKSNGK